MDQNKLGRIKECIELVAKCDFKGLGHPRYSDARLIGDLGLEIEHLESKNKIMLNQLEKIANDEHLPNCDCWVDDGGADLDCPKNRAKLAIKESSEVGARVPYILK